MVGRTDRRGQRTSLLESSQLRRQTALRNADGRRSHRVRETSTKRDPRVIASSVFAAWHPVGQLYAVVRDRRLTLHALKMKATVPSRLTVTCLGGVHGDCRNAAECDCICHRHFSAAKQRARVYRPALLLAASVGKSARFLEQRRHIEAIWELVSKPIKLPNRRRREDRELPSKVA
jgi:hypothetical protein